MFPELPGGIPLWQDYKQLIFCDDFGEMAIHAEMFLQEQSEALDELPFRYRYDFLQQWNKRWELAFAIQHARKQLPANAVDAQVLLYGADFNFFPWYFQAMTGCTLTCLSDQNLLDSFPIQQSFAAVSMASPFVSLQGGDLFLPSLAEAQYELVICLGCEQFLGQLPQVISALYKSLKPGGHLLFSFDISLVGRQGIDETTGNEILKLIDACFDSELFLDYSFEKLNKQRNILTTKYVSEISSPIMPWNMSNLAYLLGSFTQSELWLKWPVSKTLFCGIAAKKP